MSEVPKRIFQTHKSLAYVESKPKLADAAQSWRAHEGEFEYSFSDDAACEALIKTHFDEKVQRAYAMLPLAVMRADLWRYCAVYVHGGIYADIDTVCNVHPDIFVNDALLTIAPESDDFHLCQWVFSAPAGSPVLKSVIDLCVERTLVSDFKGEHLIHFLTGPGCFTTGVENFLKGANLPTFSLRTKYADYPDKALKVYECQTFHRDCVVHLFAGQDADGWYQERDAKIPK